MPRNKAPRNKEKSSNHKPIRKALGLPSQREAKEEN